MFAALQPGKVAAEQAVRGGLTLIESGLLGAITVVAIAVAVLAVWKVLSVQDARVADREKADLKRDKLLSEVIDLNKKMTETFIDLKASIDLLRESEKEGQEVLRGVRQAVDTTILEAVRRGG